MKNYEELIKKKHEFLEHTADAKLRAYGKTLEEAFANGAVALFLIITDVSKVEKKIEKKISVVANNKESLLFDFFENLIYLIDTEGFLLAEVKKIKIVAEKNAFKLDVEILGDNADKYETYSQLKAMTYHDLIINEETEFAMIQVVPDI